MAQDVTKSLDRRFSILKDKLVIGFEVRLIMVGLIVSELFLQIFDHLEDLECFNSIHLI